MVEFSFAEAGPQVFLLLSVGTLGIAELEGREGEREGGRGEGMWHA
jgi:hypothetical protein